MKNPPSKSTHLLALGLALSASSAHAAITAVNDGTFGGVAPPANGIVTSSVTVGATADMLILMTSMELGSGTLAVTYGGVDMVRATGNTSNSNIFFLDLATPGITGTNFVVDMSGFSTRNGFAAGWVSIDGNLGVGETIALHSTATSAAQFNTLGLTTTVETFNVVNFNGNNTSGTITVGAPIQAGEVIYTDNNIGSARGAAAFDQGVAAGTTDYSWTISGEAAPPNSDYRRIDAAAFAVVPEPNAAALIGGFGVLALLRRRRK